MKNIILTFVFLWVFNCYGATFKFKDGTVVEGYIYEKNLSIGNASPDGILLVSDNKFYLHHYPVKTKEKIIDHGNGRYTIEEEVIPTPAPPTSGLSNPYPLPRCVPARINFIHFDSQTLNTLYKHYSSKAKYHKVIVDKYPNNLLHRMAFDDNKAIALGIYKAAHAKSFKTHSQDLYSKWNMTVKKEFNTHSSFILWGGN